MSHPEPGRRVLAPSGTSLLAGLTPEQARPSRAAPARCYRSRAKSDCRRAQNVQPSSCRKDPSTLRPSWRQKAWDPPSPCEHFQPRMFHTTPHLGLVLLLGRVMNARNAARIRLRALEQVVGPKTVRTLALPR